MSGQENLHSKIEKNIALMMVLIVVVISFSVLVEIIPLAFQKDVVEPIKGLKPLNAL